MVGPILWPFKHNTVEPRFNKVPRDWRNLFVKSLNSLYRTPPFKRGALGVTQYRNTVRKNGKYRNTRWKIVEISIPHILITFIIDSTYLRLLPSGAFNYLRHLCTRCLFFFIVFDSSQIFRKFSLKSKLHSFNLLVGLPNRLLTPIKNNFLKARKQKQKTNQPKPFPRTSSASFDKWV